MLSAADGGAVAQFYLGKTQFTQGNYQQAIECYNAAKVAGYHPDQCALADSEALTLRWGPTRRARPS